MIKEMKNVYKGGQKVNKHVEVQAKSVFDEWRFFCGLTPINQLMIFKR